jgi:DNA polymerase I-like protein with 3'-5' exonuclease and polymerase domains
LNLPKKWKKAAGAGYVHPAFLKVPELPFVRTYALPDKGKQWGRRDFNQQELRLFGHFEDGFVMNGFLSDPKFDIHEIVRAEIERQLIAAGLRDSFDRDTAKGVVFARLYGQGLNGLMELLKLPDGEQAVARLVQKAVNAAVPSIKALDDQIKELYRDKSPDFPDGKPIRTWGGRLYYCEPPKYVEKFGRNMTFEYKGLNYLAQGSGADVTKEVIVRYYAHPKRGEDLIVTVYDELDINLPLSSRGARQEMQVLKECMLSIETDVPMLSDGESGPSWGELSKFPV